jgi:hypothetical protein
MGMNALRFFAVQATTAILGFFLIVAVVLQCRDFKSATEVFPIAGFAVFLTLASFAISWARVNPPNATLAEQRRVKRAGLDFLIATGLTLVSAGLLRLAQDALLKDTLVALPILVLHVLSLAVGLFVGWVALVSLLRQAVVPASDPDVTN